MMTRPDDRDSALRDSITPAFQRGLAEIVTPYLDLAAALAADDLTTARSTARTLHDETQAFSPTSPEAAVQALVPMRRALEGASREIIDAFGNPTDETVHRVHCPMAFDFAGAEWLQRSDTVANAYFGHEMLTCGTVRHAYEADGRGEGEGEREGEREGAGEGEGERQGAGEAGAGAGAGTGTGAGAGGREREDEHQHEHGHMGGGPR
jgi:hypothetical protein